MADKQAQVIRRKIIGVLLRQARTNAGRTLKECAEILDISAGTLSICERGQRDLSLPELEALAFFLDIPLEHLLDSQSASPEEAKADFPGTALLEVRHRIVGVKLRRARQDLDMSQKELAAQLDIPPSRISQYEYGHKPIPFTELEQMAEILEVPLNYFLDRGIGTVGKQQQRESDWQRFTKMPVDIQTFVLDPINLPYIQVAMRLSGVPANKLRDIAAGLLDITF